MNLAMLILRVSVKRVTTSSNFSAHVWRFPVPNNARPPPPATFNHSQSLITVSVRYRIMPGHRHLQHSTIHNHLSQSVFTTEQCQATATCNIQPFTITYHSQCSLPNNARPPPPATFNHSQSLITVSVRYRTMPGHRHLQHSTIHNHLSQSVFTTEQCQATATCNIQPFTITYHSQCSLPNNARPPPPATFNHSQSLITVSVRHRTMPGHRHLQHSTIHNHLSQSVFVTEQCQATATCNIQPFTITYHSQCSLPNNARPPPPATFNHSQSLITVSVRYRTMPGHRHLQHSTLWKVLHNSV